MSLFRLLGVFAGFGLGLLTLARAADSYDVNSAAQVIVFGELRAPSAAAGPADQPIGRVVAALKQHLASDRMAAAAVAAKARRDAFGPAAPNAEGGDKPLTYAECMRHNVDELTRSPDRYEAVIRAAYPIVIHREAYPEELAYWKKHGVVPYDLLLAAIENWARRNQPGLMVTAGEPTISINSAYLATIRVSPDAAAEVRALLGLAPTAAGGGEANRGQLLAAGADGIETDGGMYFVAAGR